MKATKAGNTIGKAVENFDPKNGKGEIIPCPAGTPANVVCGSVVTFVNTSWYDPDAYLTSTGDLEIRGVDSQFAVHNRKADRVIDRIGAFTELVVAKIKAGVIDAKKLIVNGVDVMERLNQQQKEIDELKRTVNSLRKSQ